MADYTVSFAKHATLAASTVDKVTLQANREIIQVSNHHATDAIYVTFGAPDPVAAADDTHIVVAGTVAEFILPILIAIGLFTRLAALGMIGFVIVQTLTDLFGHGGCRGCRFVGTGRVHCQAKNGKTQKRT